MKGFRFYLEYPTATAKRRDPGARGWNEHSSGTVCALMTERPTSHSDHYEGFHGIYEHPNSPVNWGSVSRGYLRTKCRRIPESMAREIHPLLFVRLDGDAWPL